MAKTLTARVTDQAGNVGTAGGSLTMTLDTAVPTVGITDTSAHAYTENGTAAAIAGSATVTEAGSPGFSVLAVQITANAEATDRLSLLTGTDTGINVSGTDLRSGTTAIGTVTASSVTGGTAWTITFGATATAQNIQDTIAAIRYDSTSENPGTSNRTVSFTLTDGAGNAGTAATRTVAVTAVNDAPTGIALSASAISVFDAANTAIGTLSATDVESHTVTFTLGTVTGVDANSQPITINGTPFTLTGTNNATLQAGTPSALTPAPTRSPSPPTTARAPTTRPPAR